MWSLKTAGYQGVQGVPEAQSAAALHGGWGHRPCQMNQVRGMDIGGLVQKIFGLEYPK